MRIRHVCNGCGHVFDEVHLDVPRFGPAERLVQDMLRRRSMCPRCGGEVLALSDDDMVEHLTPHARQVQAGVEDETERLIRRIVEEDQDDWTDDWLAAVRTLSERKERRAVRPLIAFLDTKNMRFFAASKRVHAIEALGRIGDPSSIKPLCSVLDYVDDNDMLQNTLLRILTKFGSAAVGPLCHQVQNGSTRVGRLLAVWALDSIGDKSALPVLRKRCGFLGGERHSDVKDAIRKAISNIERR